MTEADSRSYSRVAKTLHWLIGLLVILLLIFGRIMEDMPLVEKQAFVMVHSGIGLLILVLMILRFVWRQMHPPPALPHATAPQALWRNAISNFVHLMFYVLVILQPIFGLLQAVFVDYEVKAFGLLNLSAFAAASEGEARFFHVLHGVTANLLILLILIHASAALYHHFFLRDQVLRRMLPFVKVKD